LDSEWEYLYQLNRYLIETISREFLGVDTAFKDSREFPSHGVKNEKLLSLLQSTGGSVYISGPAAKDYMDIQEYENAGIDIVGKDYLGYPEYAQSSSQFELGVSILDLIFNTGPDAPYYIGGWRAS